MNEFDELNPVLDDVWIRIEEFETDEENLERQLKKRKLEKKPSSNGISKVSNEKDENSDDVQIIAHRDPNSSDCSTEINEKTDINIIVKKKIDKKKKKKKKECLLNPEELELNLQEERSISESWIGREAEFYWHIPEDKRGFYRGTIRDRKVFGKDYKYFVEYSISDDFKDFEVWEHVDTGMRFIEEQFNNEIEKVIELRKNRGSYNERKVNSRSFNNKKIHVKLQKHTRVGQNFQVSESVLENCSPAKSHIINTSQSEIGTPLWDPSKINELDVKGFLNDVKIVKPLIDQFDIQPFKEYVPNTSIISEATILHFLMNYNYDTNMTKKYIKESKKNFTDRGFAVTAKWSEEEIRKFENALKMSDDTYDLREIQEIVDSKNIYEIVQFFYAWRSSKRYIKWKNESISTTLNQYEYSRSKTALRNVARVNYNDDVNHLITQKPRNSIANKILVDEKVIKESDTSNFIAFEIIINATIYDLEDDKNRCLQYITKRNFKTDDYLFSLDF